MHTCAVITIHIYSYIFFLSFHMNRYQNHNQITSTPTPHFIFARTSIICNKTLHVFTYMYIMYIEINLSPLPFY